MYMDSIDYLIAMIRNQRESTCISKNAHTEGDREGERDGRVIEMYNYTIVNGSFG